MYKTWQQKIIGRYGMAKLLVISSDFCKALGFEGFSSSCC